MMLPGGTASAVSDGGVEIFLFINDGSMENSGTYTCLAHSHSGFFNAAVSVNVQFEGMS